MAEFIVKRKDVCAGTLLKIHNSSITIFDCEGKPISPEQSEEQENISVITFSGIVCRAMLYCVNDAGLAEDLIYKTPTNYLIRGVESKSDENSDFINEDSCFVIDEHVPLEKLLNYLGYGEELTQRDLNRIFNKLVVRNWWLKHHLKLFGYQKMGFGMGYCSGGTQTLPIEIFNHLLSISCIGNGKPSKEEPNHGLIMKIK